MADANSDLTPGEVTQLSMQPALDGIDAYFDTNSSLKEQLVQVAVDLPSATILVYWYGSVPANLQSDLNQIASQSQSSVRIVQSRYTSSQIDAATDQAIDDPSATSASFDYSTQTLKVGTSRSSNVPLSKRSAPTEVDGIPVVYYQSGATLLAKRQDDASPWTGGARVVAHGTGCSSGFGLVIHADPYMVTAGHCYSNGDVITDGAGDRMGTAQGRMLSSDSILIPVDKLSGYMYDGSWKNSAGARERVVGENTKLKVGQEVCTSGASTGTHCGLVIRSIRANWKVYSTKVVGIEARPDNGSAVAGGTGDSGGPVLTNTSVAREVRAAGIISKGEDSVKCSGYSTTECFNTVFIAPIINVERDGGVAIGH